MLRSLICPGGKITIFQFRSKIRIEVKKYAYVGIEKGTHAEIVLAPVTNVTNLDFIDK